MIGRLGLTPGGKHLPGCLLHWVTETDEGIRIVDVWESREPYGRFAEQVAPDGRAVGYPNPPETVLCDVHNDLVAD